MSVHRAKRERDIDLVAAVVRELEMGGALKDPRPRPEDRLTPLADYVLVEVRLSLYRVRSLQNGDVEKLIHELRTRGKLPPTPNINIRKIKKAVTVLRSIVRFEDQSAVLDQFDAFWQEPPERRKALKWRCAAEAFDLMAFFSAKPPTGTPTGPFQEIAAMIYEAVTGETHTDVNIKRACDAILAARRKHNPNAFLIN
jgi:hypothetical protein